MKGVIQIGSHYAEEYEGWLSLGATNFIFFEPVPESYEKMVRILPKTDNIKTYQMAIGNLYGKAFMFIETEHQGKSCSILRPFLHLEQYPDIKFTHRIMVDINKLDNIEYDRSLYDHLHIDTQGYEVEVLKGANESLKSIETIECEVYRQELYHNCPMSDQVVNYLEQRGFELIDIFWRGNTWGDAKFKRV